MRLIISICPNKAMLRKKEFERWVCPRVLEQFFSIRQETKQSYSPLEPGASMEAEVITENREY